MNIGFVCHEFPPGPTGGIGTFTAELANGLTESGHHVHIACVDHSIRSDSSKCISPLTTMHRVAAARGSIRGHTNRVKLFLLIRRLAAERRIDVIEVPDFEGWCAGWPKLPIPVVVRLHGSATYFASEMGDSIPTSIRLIERSAIRRADHVLSVSDYTARRTAEMFHLPVSPGVIYNSVLQPDTCKIKMDYSSRDLVCYTGTLVEKKGVFALARAWPLVKQRHPRARLMMIGRDGRHGSRSSADVIRKLAGISCDSIEILDHRPKAEIERLLALADVAVYPSYSEAFALAPMEAMSLGVPTIYTARASGPELMRHGVDGCLCDPDNVSLLAEQITTLLQSQCLRRQLGEAGRRRVCEHFSYRVLLRNNIDMYHKVSLATKKHCH